jgi:hypothetical protein
VARQTVRLSSKAAQVSVDPGAEDPWGSFPASPLPRRAGSDNKRRAQMHYYQAQPTVVTTVDAPTLFVIVEHIGWRDLLRHFGSRPAVHLRAG